MKRTLTTLFAIAASFALANAALAQGRHDEKPHGYNPKVAAEQTANSSPTTYVTIPGGPRAQDNPLSGKKIAIAQPTKDQAPLTASTSQKQ